MKIENVKPLIVGNYMDTNRRNRALIILGPSGVGKSESIRDAAKEIADAIKDPNFGFIDKRLATEDLVTIGGVPSVSNGVTVRNIPDWFPKADTNGILILDEITSAPAAMQALAYQITLDRCLCGTPLPAGWMVIAAGNRASDRGVHFPLAAPLLARMTVINVLSSLDGFMAYATEKGVRQEVIAYLASRPDHLNQRDENINSDVSDLPLNEPFANQRSWVTAAQYYLDERKDIRLELLQGCVGKRAAADFETFLRVYEDMPSIEQIRKEPMTTPVPNDTSTRWAVSVGIAGRIDAENFADFIQYLERMPKEFSTLAVMMAYRRDRAFASTGAFAKYVSDNSALFSGR
jgi:hypothetical protein